jgi:hypothetical protein
LARALYLHDYQLLPYARTAEAMKELFGGALSKGTLATVVKQCADALVETELKIKRGLRRSAVLHADETGLRRSHRPKCPSMCAGKRATCCCGWNGGRKRCCAS